MRDHNKAFCSLVAETFDCPGPVFEFGSYQVDGQEGYANLRGLFANKSYVGCDMRPGPGVDRVEDVTAISLPDGSAGTVLCIETFEHVFAVSKAFDEVFRLLKPGGIFVITSPLNFRIHGYPDDYWRMTPNCLRRHLSPYAARVSGYQGYHAFPHTVMGVGLKAPVALDCVAQAGDARRRHIRPGSSEREASLPLGEKLRRRASMIYRSKGERHQIAGYYEADFTIDLEPGVRQHRPASDDPRGARHGGPLSLASRGSAGAARPWTIRNDPMPKTVDRLLVLGLDGATWTVLDPMRQRGLMPNLDAFLARAASGTLRSIIPPVTTAAWTTMMTGCGPARHGVFDHRYYDAAEGRMKVNHSGRIRVPTVWHLLAGTGRSIVSLNMPGLYPPLKVRGIVVSGMDAPHLEAALSAAPEFAARLRGRGARLRPGLLLETGTTIARRADHEAPA